MFTVTKRINDVKGWQVNCQRTIVRFENEQHEDTSSLGTDVKETGF